MCQDPQGKSARRPGSPSYVMLSTRAAAMQETREGHDPKPSTRVRGPRRPANPQRFPPSACLPAHLSLSLSTYPHLSVYHLYLSPIIYHLFIYLPIDYLLSITYLHPYLPIVYLSLSDPLFTGR